MKTEKLRKGEVENGKEKTAKMRTQKIEKTMKSVRARRAFEQNRKDAKIGIARDEISIKNRKIGSKAKNERLKPRGNKGIKSQLKINLKKFRKTLANSPSARYNNQCKRYELSNHSLRYISGDSVVYANACSVNVPQGRKEEF